VSILIVFNPIVLRLMTWRTIPVSWLHRPRWLHVSRLERVLLLW